MRCDSQDSAHFGPTHTHTFTYRWAFSGAVLIKPASVFLVVAVDILMPRDATHVAITYFVLFYYFINPRSENRDDFHSGSILIVLAKCENWSFKNLKKKTLNSWRYNSVKSHEAKKNYWEKIFKDNFSCHCKSVRCPFPPLYPLYLRYCKVYSVTPFYCRIQIIRFSRNRPLTCLSYCQLLLRFGS